MNNTIWKFPLEVTDHQSVVMPQGAHALSVGLDPQGQLCLWALVDPELDLLPLEVVIVGTGHRSYLIEHLRFLGSVVQGSFVWHVFVETE